MIYVLIIFLCLLFFIFIKFNINFEVRILGENFFAKYKLPFLNKKIKEGNVFEFIKSGKGEMDFSILKNISKYISIDQVEANVHIGTPFIFLTNIFAVTVSSVIPILYNLDFKSKQNMTYKVSGSYEDFKFTFDINGRARINVYQLLMIFLKIKRSLIKIRE